LPVIFRGTFLREEYSNLITFSKKCRYSKPKGGKMNRYVGNISWDLTEEDLKEAFEAFGQTTSVKIIKDKHTGKSRGFAFVEMPEKAEAEAAMKDLNGKELKGREIVVNEARPRPEGFRGDKRRSGASRGEGSEW
jgi:RNA recognition motif-containing protein